MHGGNRLRNATSKQHDTTAATRAGNPANKQTHTENKQTQQQTNERTQKQTNTAAIAARRRTANTDRSIGVGGRLTYLTGSDELPLLAHELTTGSLDGREAPAGMPAPRQRYRPIDDAMVHANTPKS